MILSLKGYEAKNTGNVAAVTQQFAQTVNNAKNKMNMLLNPSAEVINLVTNMYNNSGGGTPAANNPPAAKNPFSLNNTTGNTFGGQNQATANRFGGASSVFGGATQSTNLFGSSTQNQSANLFGAAANATPAANNPFAATTANNSGNLFGGSSFGSNANTSVFGNQANVSPFGASSGNAFGGATQTATANGNLFGAAPTSTATSVFGNSQSTTANAFGAQQSQQQSTNVFGIAAAAQSNPIFGGPPKFGSNPGAGLFAQANTMTTPANTGNIFGQTIPNSQSTFGTVAQQPQQQQGNIFGSAMQQQQQQQPQAQAHTQSIFGQQNAQQPASNVFGMAQSTQPTQTANLFGSAPVGGQNIFGSTATPAQPQPQTQNGNLFANAATPNANSSVFGASNSFQNQQALPTQQTQSIFGQSAAQTPAAPTTVYSSVAALSEADLNAFKANRFELGHIPIRAPPRELCV